MTNHMKRDSGFDCIIIGSGIGALACASVLSLIWKKKVLVLERHFKPGGFTHVFRRNAQYTYEWDVGLHYVGEMQQRSQSRDVFDFITQGQLQWQEMPDVYDIFIYPDMIFKARKGRENIKTDLIRLFPQEKQAIRRYFKDMSAASRWFRRYLLSAMLPDSLLALGRWIRNMGSDTWLSTTQKYLDEHFNDQRLIAILASLWGTYGLPPQNSALIIHALIFNHYLNGGYYPVGGSKKIADTIIPCIERNQGQVLVNHRVTEIIIDNGRATGVRVLQDKKGEEAEHIFFADKIISAAGADITYRGLLKGMYAKEIESMGTGTAHVALYAGLKNDPRTLGLYGENYWIYSSYDHNKIFMERNKLVNGSVSHCYVSFPSLKNPSAGAHTMEVIAFLDSDVFGDWAAQPWKKRDEKYQKCKERIVSSLLQTVEEKIPGIRDLVDYTELSTPLSTQYFTGYTGGAIYGLPATPCRYQQEWLKIRTPVRNLYLTGSDIVSHGICGAMYGGIFTAAEVMGLPFSLFRIFKEIRNFNRQLFPGGNGTDPA